MFMVSSSEMICKKCGCKIEEGKDWCSNCGTVVTVQEVKRKMTTDKIKDVVKDKKKLLVGAAGAVVVAGGAFITLIVCILVICILAGSGHKSAVKDYFKAFEKANVKKMVSLSIPKSISDEIYEDYYKRDKKEFIEETQEALEDCWEDLKDYDGDFKWEIKKVENIDKLDDLEEDALVDDLDDFKMWLEHDYEYYGFNADKVKKAYAVEVKFTLKCDGETERYTEIVYVYKYKGKWQVYDGTDVLYEAEKYGIKSAIRYGF